MSVWLGVLLAVVGAAGTALAQWTGLWTAMRKTPVEVKLTGEQAANLTAQRNQMFDDRYADLVGTMRTDLDSVRAHSEVQDREIRGLRAELVVARDTALAARTREAESNIEVAQVRAQLAEALQHASEERHTMANEFNAALLAKDLAIEELHQQVNALREQVNTLLGQLGFRDRRNADEERREEDVA